MQFLTFSRTPSAIPLVGSFFFCPLPAIPIIADYVSHPGVLLLKPLTGVPAAIADQDKRASPLQGEPLLFPILAS
jgi:hypothetical protein